MLNYLHDIRNKLAIVSAHTNRLARKYNDEELVTITTNLTRINDLINDAYKAATEKKHEELTLFPVQDFIKRFDVLVEALALSFPLEFKNQVSQVVIENITEVKINIHLLTQVLENAIDNSLKANSTKIYIRLIEDGRKLIIEMVDNGHGLIQQSKPDTEVSSIPHGMGKKIIKENMHKMGGVADWQPRMDGSGMIVRLTLPSTIAPLV